MQIFLSLNADARGKARLTLTGSRNYSVMEEKEEQIIVSMELPVSGGEVHFEKEVKNRISGCGDPEFIHAYDRMF